MTKGDLSLELYAAPPAHDDEAALVKAKPKPSKQKDKPGLSDEERWRRRMMRLAPAMVYQRDGIQLEYALPMGEHTMNLRFSMITARDEAEYYEGLLALMDDPGGEAAQKRLRRRCGRVPVINVIDRDRIEFNTDRYAVLKRGDVIERLGAAMKRYGDAFAELSRLKAEYEQSEGRRRYAELEAYLGSI